MSRILLLLDHRENRRLLAAELERGHDVAPAADDDALEEPYDLLVIDGRALDRTFERVRERRRSERPLHLPVLLVTSRPDVRMVTRHLWRGVDDVIVTPIERPELRARIEVLLRVRAQSRELRERAEIAERAVQTREEVMGMVSHDLRNPLNAVLAYASLLLETATNLSPKQTAHLEAIHRAAGQMSRLTEDLVDVAALESGQVKVRPSPEPVDPLVQGACEHHRQAAREKGVELTCEVDEGLPPAAVDRGRFDQLMGNLIGNALKFTPAGGSVVVRCVAAGDRVRFSVEDTGPGLTREDSARVFDRFWQGASSDGGAGLGLAIAKAIVEGHGGSIGVISTHGRGARFWFEIPVAEG